MPEEQNIDGFRSAQSWPPQSHHQPPDPAHAHTHHTEHAVSHHPKTPQASISGLLRPVPVVKMLSTRGMEYAMMSVSLWITAVALVWILLNLANGSRSFNFLVVPTSALVVSLPIYMFFFFRLKRAEIKDPALMLDPSRRRWSQLTQFAAFVASLVNLIIFAYEILARYGNNKGSIHSVSRSAIDAGVVLLVTLSLLAYFWIDEHRLS